MCVSAPSHCFPKDSLEACNYVIGEEVTSKTDEKIKNLIKDEL